MSSGGRKWVEYIKRKLCEKELEGSDTQEQIWPSIFMASSPLRGLKHEAFIPQVVSIGPYHNDIGPHHSAFPPMNEEAERYKGIAAKEMQMHKIIACKLAQKKFKEGKTIIDLASSFQEKLNTIIIPQYDTELDELLEDEEKLALMFALDTCFVVEVLKANYYHPFDIDDDEGSHSITIRQMGFDIKTSFSKYYRTSIPRPLRKSIVQDFVLLENQVPMVCLIEMVMMYSGCGTKADVEQILRNIFMKVAEEVLPFEVEGSTSSDKIHALGSDSKSLLLGGEDVLLERKHLLDWLYAMVTQNHDNAMQGKTSKLVLNPSHFPRAIELYNRGVKFQPSPAPSNATSVYYNKSNSTLYLPKIHVGDETERLFRNLIAYESHLVDYINVLSYLRFMDILVDTEEDVALLVSKGVISQDIGTDQLVASMMNDLCRNTMRLWSEQFEDIAVSLRAHCSHLRNAWKAEITRDYFSKPWLIISVLSAAALLIMTLLITIYTIFLYKKGG